MRARHALLLASALVGLALVSSAHGCVQDGLGRDGAVRLATHVQSDGAASGQDWRDQIIYQMLTDRFANGDAATDFRTVPGVLARYQGGDWQGAIDHLDYLEELGVTALWISPIVLNVDTDAGVDAYHGYWAVDLTRLNPHFGDLATLRSFVNAAHRRHMVVILDIVTNHMGQVFYYDINNNGQPDDSVMGSGTRSPLTRTTEYDPDYDPRGIQGYTSLGESGPAPVRFFDMPDIFRVIPQPADVFGDPANYHRRGRVTDYNIREQVLFGDFPGGLKDLATENQPVRDAMVESYVHWVLETDIDGFRIDTLKHVDDGFWLDFAPRVRQRLHEAGKDNFFMFGEAFDGDDALIGHYTSPGMLDSVFYFSQKFQVFRDVFQQGGATRAIEGLYNQRATHFGMAPQDMGIGVAPHDALVNFMDNHDVPRFLNDPPSASVCPAGDTECPIETLHAALAYLMTEDGIPCLYYGTEQDFAGGNDPQNREVLWSSGYDTTGATFRWVSRLTHIRRAYPALTHGDFHIRWVTDHTGDEMDAGVVAFERTTANSDYALVVINTQGRHDAHTTDGTSTMTVAAPAGAVLVDILGSDSFTVAAGGTLDVPVAPHQARILVPESQRVPGL
jgi:glycosidase